MKKRVLKMLLSGIMLVCFLSGCGGETQYDRDYKSGMEKYRSGQKMTEGEANAVKNFLDWKSKQGEKTYNEWYG